MIVWAHTHVKAKIFQLLGETGRQPARGKACRLRLQPRMDLYDAKKFLQRRFEQHRAPAGMPLHETRGLQPDQRFAHRRTRNAVPRDQCLFVDDLARTDLAVIDGGQYRVDYRVRLAGHWIVPNILRWLVYI